MSDLEWRLRVGAEAYPEDIFPPLTDEEKAALPRGTIDRCSAAMARHIAGILIEAADRIAELQGRIDAAIKIVYGQGKPELKASRMLEVLEQGAALREGENEN